MAEGGVSNLEHVAIKTTTGGGFVVLPQSAGGPRSELVSSVASYAEIASNATNKRSANYDQEDL